MIKTYDFKGIKLGWSLMGQRMMTPYCYMIGDVMVLLNRRAHDL